MRSDTAKVLEHLKNYPVFTLAMIARRMKASQGYLKLLIHRLIQRKEIVALEKNKYTQCKDPWIVASNIAWPSYITGWAALRYHNLTEQLPNTIEVVTSTKRRKRELLFQRMKIKFITAAPVLMFGYDKYFRDEKELWVAKPEKALLDAALFKSMSFSEISEIITYNITHLQKGKIVEYLIKIGNKSLIKRFGFVLDNAGKDYYRRFYRYIDHNYIPLDYSLPPRGKKDKKWRVINNVI